MEDSGEALLFFSYSGDMEEVTVETWKKSWLAREVLWVPGQDSYDNKYEQ